MEEINVVYVVLAAAIICAMSIFATAAIVDFFKKTANEVSQKLHKLQDMLDVETERLHALISLNSELRKTFDLSTIEIMENVPTHQTVDALKIENKSLIDRNRELEEKMKNY